MKRAWIVLLIAALIVGAFPVFAENNGNGKWTGWYDISFQAEWDGLTILVNPVSHLRHEIGRIYDVAGMDADLLMKSYLGGWNKEKCFNNLWTWYVSAYSTFGEYANVNPWTGDRILADFGDYAPFGEGNFRIEENTRYKAVDMEEVVWEDLDLDGEKEYGECTYNGLLVVYQNYIIIHSVITVYDMQGHRVEEYDFVQEGVTSAGVGHPVN